MYCKKKVFFFFFDLIPDFSHHCELGSNLVVEPRLTQPTSGLGIFVGLAPMSRVGGDFMGRVVKGS